MASTIWRIYCGVVERDRIITGKDVQMETWFSACLRMACTPMDTRWRRKLLFEIAHYSPDDYVNEIKNKVGNELMRTHKSYWPALRKLIDGQCVFRTGACYGGRNHGNIWPRVLPRHGSFDVNLVRASAAIVRAPAAVGNVPQEEMLRTFNMGLGMLVVVPLAKFKKAQSVLDRVGEKAYTVGRIVKGERK